MLETEEERSRKCWTRKRNAEASKFFCVALGRFEKLDMVLVVGGGCLGAAKWGALVVEVWSEFG